MYAPPTKNLLIATACWIFVCLAALPIRAAEPVRVRLFDGRRFVALVDHQTDDRQLTLRFEGSTAHILRSFAWNRIETVWHGEQRYTPEEFRPRAAGEASEFQPADRPPAPPHDPAEDSHTWPASVEPPDRSPRSLEIDARIANWNADPQSDGILLTLYPLDAVGAVAPFQGRVEVHAYAFRQQAFHAAPRGRGRTLSTVGRWSFPVADHEGSQRGVVVRCPFQSVHPEFTHDGPIYASLHVRLTIPGHGVFERTLESVRLRPFSPLRDALQRDTGTRFLTNERTQRGSGYFGG